MTFNFSIAFSGSTDMKRKTPLPELMTILSGRQSAAPVPSHIKFLMLGLEKAEMYRCCNIFNFDIKNGNSRSDLKSYKIVGYLCKSPIV